MSNSSDPIAHAKANRPDGFPLSVHLRGRWCKKIKGRLHYFGKLDDPQAALERWLRAKDYLLAGKPPPPEQSNGLTVRERVNRFLIHQQKLVDSRELSPLSWSEYNRTCTRLILATITSSPC